MRKHIAVVVAVVITALGGCATTAVGNRGTERVPLPPCRGDSVYQKFRWPDDRPDVIAVVADRSPLDEEIARFAGSHAALIHVGVAADGFAVCVDAHGPEGSFDEFAMASLWGVARMRWTPATKSGVAVDSVRFFTVKKVRTTDEAACIDEGVVAFCEPRARELEPTDAAAARRLRVAGCSRGDGQSCMSLARMQTFGLGGPEDLDAAFRIADEHCKHGDEDMCVRRGAVAERRGTGRRPAVSTSTPASKRAPGAAEPPATS